MCKAADYKASALAFVPTLQFLDYIAISPAEIQTAVDQHVCDP